jgi:hypothetical protein
VGGRTALACLEYLLAFAAAAHVHSEVVPRFAVFCNENPTNPLVYPNPAGLCLALLFYFLVLFHYFTPYTFFLGSEPGSHFQGAGTMY